MLLIRQCTKLSSENFSCTIYSLLCFTLIFKSKIPWQTWLDIEIQIHLKEFVLKVILRLLIRLQILWKFDEIVIYGELSARKTIFVISKNLNTVYTIRHCPSSYWVCLVLLTQTSEQLVNFVCIESVAIAIYWLNIEQCLYSNR